MDEPTGFALRLSYELAGVNDRHAFLLAADQSLGYVLPGDSIGWVRARPSAGTVEIVGTDDSGRPEVQEALERTIEQHPMMISFRANPYDLAPRRMSDLVDMRFWRRHVVYQEVFRPISAVHQLVITLMPQPPHVWDTWVFNRGGDDFTDDEMALAANLQPMLITLDRLSRLASRVPNAGDPGRLSAREIDVLRYLAADFSATDIARILRITVPTVRKHLEHLYAKLGCHDRLGAVATGIRLGVIEGMGAEPVLTGSAS
jgi:DNA-binding CsgD family transcriptional regulator